MNVHTRPADVIGTAHAAFAKAVAAIIPARLAIINEPDDFRAVAEYLSAIARAVDHLIEAVGEEVSAHAPCRIDVAMFQHQMRAALEGYALHEIECAARRMEEDRG